MRKIPLIFLLTFAIHTFSQTSANKGLETINEQTAKTYISILAHDSLEGREAGKPAGLRTANYLKNQFIEIGIKPWRGDYFQPFVGGRGNETARRTPNMQNVLGCIPGKNDTEIIVIGAHFDHLGVKDNIKGDNIFNGADDNATGVSAVLQVAKAFVATGEKPERTIVFALWDGEEKGLLGSFHFVDNHASYIPIPLINPPAIKGCINLDMIGRNNNEKTDSLSHVKSTISKDNPAFETWIKEDIEKHNLNLTPELVYLEKSSRSMNSDHAPFFAKGVPVIYYNTGLHRDYHRVSDHEDKINYEKVVNITKLAFLNLWNMATTENY